MGEGGQAEGRQQPGPSAVQSVPALGFSSEPLEEATVICLGLCSVQSPHSTPHNPPSAPPAPALSAGNSFCLLPLMEAMKINGA